MTIIYFGLTCFRIQDNNLSLLIDPFESGTGLNLPRMQNDIVLLTQKQNKKDFSGKTMVIDSPGEYELKDCFVYGIPFNNGDEEELVYLIELEGIKIAYLGLLKRTKLTDQDMEKLDGVDLLLLPVGGANSLNASQAAEIATELEARVVVPMNYQLPGLKQKLEPLEKFKKESGLKAEEVDKLKINKKDLPQEDTKLIIIKPSAA